MSDRSTPSRTWQVWGAGLLALLLLAFGAAGHVWYLLANCPLDLSGDEAHYWEWSRHLDLSYYSKGPLVAYIIAAGRWGLGELSRTLLGNEVLAVRGPAILLSLLTGLGIYVLGVLALRRPWLALGAVAWTCTVPIFAVGAMLMTIDAPLACCYVWALVAIVVALRGDALAPWLAAGVLIALGILAKYNMVLLFPPVGLALLTRPAWRRHLRRPGPYLATLVGFLGLVPILVWNARHGWVSFRHVAGQAGVSAAPAIDFVGPLNMLAGQAAVVGPVWFIALLVAVVALLRRPQPQANERHTADDVWLLLYTTLTPWVVFLAFSFVTKIQPNWPVLALLPGGLLFVLWLARLAAAAQVGQRRWAWSIVAAGAITGGGTVLLMHRTEWLMPLLARFAPAESPLNLTPLATFDPTARLRGWHALGEAVGKQLAAERKAGREPFIVTDDYQVASQIAFYCPGNPPTYSLQAVLGNRQSQYDLWTNPIRNPDAFVGRPCIYVGSRKKELFAADAEGHVVLTGPAQATDTVVYRVDGHALQVWAIFVCERFNGIPQRLRAHLGEKF